MATTKRQSKHVPREILSRYVRVTGWDLDVFVRATGRALDNRSRASSTWLKVRGMLTEPISSAVDFDLQLGSVSDPAAGTAEVASIGSIVSIKPVVQAYVELSASEFQAVVAMATSGRLAECHLAFQKPRYGGALIVSMSFSSSLSD